MVISTALHFFSYRYRLLWAVRVEVLAGGSLACTYTQNQEEPNIQFQSALLRGSLVVRRSLMSIESISNQATRPVVSDWATVYDDTVLIYYEKNGR